MKRPTHIEVNKALTAIRKQTTRCGQSETYSDLYEQAEKLQHLAFELKSMVAHGGTWAERQEQNA